MSVQKLAQGIVSIARERNIASIGDVEEVSNNLMAELDHRSENFSRRLDALMKALHISNVEMARQVAVDPSYLSRIRNGRRTPADSTGLARRCAKYIVSHRQDRDLLGNALSVVGQDEEVPVHNAVELEELIARWLVEK